MPVIKNLTRKSSGPVIKYILRYMLSDDKQLKKESLNKPFIVRHNIRSRTIEGYIKEFKENESRRKYKRKNQIAINHTIISWNNKDTQKITDATLKAIAKQFIKLRGENNLYIISKHTDRKHIHLHCAVSSNSLDGFSNRLSKVQFAAFKIELQKFQIQHFPELHNSIPHHGKGKEFNSKLYWHANRVSQKELLQKAIEDALQQSKSAEDFVAKLKEMGHELYYRGQDKKLTGIKFQGTRKYRLRSLGIDVKKITSTNIKQQREEEQLAEITSIRNKVKERSIDQTKENTNERNFNTGIGNYPRKQNDTLSLSLPLAVEGFGEFPTRCILQED